MIFTHVDFVTNSDSGVAGVPPDKPATIQGISDVNAAPTFAGLNHRVTIGAFTTYRLSRITTWKAWQVDYDAQQAAIAAAADKAAKEAAEPDLKMLIDQAQGAIDANKTFLALQSPTNAQVLAQVKALTQQMNKLIPATTRLVIGKNLA